MGLITTPERSRLMSSVKHEDTSAELRARRIAHACGLRFRVGARDLPGTPDIVNRRAKWAIFVHGCFWHAHRNCARWKVPRNNAAFWRRKFRENRARDARKTMQLRRSGFSVLVLWECELKRDEAAISKVLRFAERLRSRDLRRARDPRHGVSGRAAQYPQEAFDYRTPNKSVSRYVLLGSGRSFTTTLSVPRIFKTGTSPKSVYDYAYLRNRERPSQAANVDGLRTVDLFSGCGGLSLGVYSACLATGRRFEPVLAVDDDTAAISVYERNFGPRFSHRGDICRIVDGALGTRLTDGEKILVDILGPVHLLLAGPPCQGHSDLNNHTRRDDGRNRLYERVGRFAEIVRPQHVLIENVPTIVHGRDHAVDNTVRLLRDCGYQVAAGVVDLSQIGVPQQRRRHVVLASLVQEISLADVVRKHRVPRPRALRWAIGDLERERPRTMFKSPSKLNEENLGRIHYLMRHGLRDLPNRLRPACHQGGDHSYKSMYGRLSYAEPAQTITSGFGSPGQGRFVHPSQPRTLTPHEAARVQFFPDWFDFSVVKTRTALATMIGNAVPMKLSYIFCLTFMEGS